MHRALERDHAFNQAAAEGLGDVDARTVRGRIAAASEPLPPRQRPVALSLCAALAQDTGLRRAMQESQAKVVHALQRDAAQPRSALLAYLALEGLKLLESLDFHTFAKQERALLLREIEALVDGRAAPEFALAPAKRRR